MVGPCKTFLYPECDHHAEFSCSLSYTVWAYIGSQKFGGDGAPAHLAAGINPKTCLSLDALPRQIWLFQVKRSGHNDGSQKYWERWVPPLGLGSVAEADPLKPIRLPHGLARRI